MKHEEQDTKYKYRLELVERGLQTLQGR